MRAMTPDEAERLAHVVRSTVHQWWVCEVRRATLMATKRGGDEVELINLAQESTAAWDAFSAALAALERAASSG